MSAQKLIFNVFDVTTQAFYRSPLSAAIVNLMPVVPGHVLIIPQRVVPRLCDLRPDEVADLFQTAQKVGNVVEKEYGATSLTLAVQDGPAAGQTVPHVHVHMLPRKPADFKPLDAVYDALDKANVEKAHEAAERAEPLHMDEDRTPRTKEDMEAEAQRLAKLFE